MAKNRIGKKLRSLRRAAKLTQTQLADSSGVAFRAIQSIEAGDNNPRVDTLESLSGALGVRLVEFFDGPQDENLLAQAARVLMRFSDVPPDVLEALVRYEWRNKGAAERVLVALKAGRKKRGRAR